MFLTGYHQIWWQRDQQVSIFSQGWGSGWWPHQGHCLRPGSGEDRRHSNQENLLRGLHKEWVYLLFGFLSLFFFNKNKVLVKDFKDHCSENMSIMLCNFTIDSSSFMVILLVWIFNKKNNASQRELTQSWIMCISLYIYIYSWNVIHMYNELVD